MARITRIASLAVIFNYLSGLWVNHSFKFNISDYYFLKFEQLIFELLDNMVPSMPLEKYALILCTYFWLKFLEVFMQKLMYLI